MAASVRPWPRLAFGNYLSPTMLSMISVPMFDDLDFQHDEEVKQLREYNGFNFDPAWTISAQAKRGLIVSSLLKSTDTLTYMGHEFENRHTPSYETVEVSIGGESFMMEVTVYSYEFMSGPTEGTLSHSGFYSSLGGGGIEAAPNSETHHDYGDVDPDGYIACISHAYSVKDFESPELWQEILSYLMDGMLPTHCDNLRERRQFLSRSRTFVAHREHLWKLGKGGKSSRLVITDLEKCKTLLAQVHNKVGHQGRDGTYKLLAERYYWPNLYDDVAYFVRSCYGCQLQSKMHPKIPFSLTWNSAILRCFYLDMVHMPKGRSRMQFLL